VRPSQALSFLLSWLLSWTSLVRQWVHRASGPAVYGWWTQQVKGGGGDLS
jgi:hypothetical protein